MARCKHGYEPAAVLCVKGCHAHLAPPVKAKAPKAARLVAPGTRAPHSALIDLTGQVLHGWTVLGRAGNSARGNARWLCRHTCSEPEPTEQVLDGIRIRNRAPKYCDACRPSRYGVHRLRFGKGAA